MVHFQPLISVCIPARNEELLIGKCLESIRVAERELGESVEIIVALNRCTDRTEDIAHHFNAITVKEDAKNLSKIRNATAKLATGKILVTIDADSIMTPNMFREIKKHLDMGKVIGGGVFIKPERMSLGIFITGIILTIIMLPFRVSAGLFWLYKRDFDAVGGFDESVLTGEDLDFGWRLKKYGRQHGKHYKMLFKAYIVTSCRKWDHFGEWYFANPLLLVRFFKGNNRTMADKHWYDVKR